MRDGMKNEKQDEKAKTRQEKTHCENTEDGARSARSNEKKAHRKLSEVSDEELRAAAEKVNSFPELRKMLGIHPKTKIAQIRKQAERAKCLDVINEYCIGKTFKVEGMSKKELQNIANKCNTYTEFGKSLGYVGSSSQCEMGRKIAEKYSLSIQHKTSRTKMSDFISEYSIDYLQEIVNNSHTFTDVAKYFEVSASFIKKVIITLSINYTHFDRYYYHINHDIFTNGKSVPGKQLLTALNSMGRMRCEICDNDGTWNGEPIPLAVHHINGKHDDNRIENLMVICPNCHSLIEGRGNDINKRKSKDRTRICEADYTCERCGKDTWLNKNIPLEIHHVSGHHFDPESPLQVLCPNCHAVETLLQNQHKEYKHISDDAFVQALKASSSIHQGILSLNLSPTGSMYQRAKKLIEQYSIQFVPPNKTKHNKKHKNSEKAKTGKRKQREIKISRDELKNKIRTESFEAIGRELGVTGSAIKKWCKHYELPWRKTDIDAFSDEEWSALKTFSDDMKRPRILHNHDAVIELLDKYHSAKYVSYLLNLPLYTINDIRRQQRYNQHMIEWSPTTCHLIEANLYFRTTADAGHWLAEQGTELKYVVPDARGKRVKRYIEQNEPLFEYQFEYVKEKDYFDIIKNHEVISYAYQEHREIPSQVTK